MIKSSLVRDISDAVSLPCGYSGKRGGASGISFSGLTPGNESKYKKLGLWLNINGDRSSPGHGNHKIFTCTGYFGCRAPTIWLSELIYVRDTTMSYCLNPDCPNQLDPNNAKELVCRHCDSNLILKDRYRVVQKLGKGGFGQVFEVVDKEGNKKVLKCLTNPEHLHSFKQEGRVLKQLWRSDIAIPRVELGEDYFIHLIEDCPPREIHCLLMEKIEGINLDRWMEKRENKPIEEKQAIEWLLQLIKILKYLHQDKKYLHLDISPSNIMVKPDGQLVLIDFGEVREITNTYYIKLGVGDEVVRRVISRYEAPEQREQGLGYPQSDFLALGLTFVHLLTGKRPCDLPKNDRTKKPIWRNSARHISKRLADLLDWMIEESKENRPANVEIIEKRLENLRSLINRPVWLREDCWQFVLPISAIATTLVMGVRLTGMLQSWELGVFDAMMRSRPQEPIDSRILVVTVDEADLQYQDQQQMTRKDSLADAALSQLLQKFAPHQPRVIGLDIFRPSGFNSNLVKTLQNNPQFITICAGGDANHSSISEPQNLPSERLGFAEIPADPDLTIRRHILTMDATDDCNTIESFSWRIAKSYLGKKIDLEQFRSKQINPRAGGYQLPANAALGYQILLNYRNAGFEQVKLREILNGAKDSQLKALVRDRIVLIGAVNDNDMHLTPYSTGLWPQGMPGVTIHAHMTSQLIGTVLDGRPLLWWWSEWGEMLWVWGWAGIGGAMVWWWRDRLILVVGLVGIVGAIAGCCYVLLLMGAWIPLVPPALAVGLTGGVVFFFIH